MAYRYLELGLRIIPIERGMKTPSPVLPYKRWGQYQDRQPTCDEVDGWLDADPHCNWALVCGQGVVCADADDLPLATWILQHATHPALRGAPIHRSGRNKAHVLIRVAGPCPSTVWRMLPGRNAGEVRSDGNYVLIPPSRLEGHGEYTRVVGSLRELPTIVDVQSYLKGITDAFLQDDPSQTGPLLDHNSKTIMVLDADAEANVINRVKGLGLKKKILDTLLQPGNQDPGTRHWTQLVDPSHSAIDFAVVAELIRKGWQFQEIEETFAATLVGDACYKNTSRPNHGQGYLKATYDNARLRVDAEAQAARQAQGANFRVAEATKAYSNDEARYRLHLESPTGQSLGWVTVTDTQILNESQFVAACFKPPMSFIPQFLAAQAGKAFKSFAEAVNKMVSEEMRLPEGSDRFGHLGYLARQAVSRLPDRVPADKLDTQNLGWRQGQVYFLRLAPLVMAIKASDRSMNPGDVTQVLDTLGPWSQIPHRWGSGESEWVIRLDLVPTGPGLRALPAS
jgi:hypothetical protein